MARKKTFKVWFSKKDGSMAHTEPPENVSGWGWLNGQYIQKHPDAKRDDLYDERAPIDFTASLKIIRIDARMTTAVVILQDINNPNHTYPMFSKDFNPVADKMVDGVLTGSFGICKHSTSYSIYYIQ